MKLQKQVCSLEYAKRLNELGVKSKSYFAHIINRSERVSVSPVFLLNENHKWIPAYTVAELGEMLPDCYDTVRVNGGWRGFDENGDMFRVERNLFDKEADARAEMLISLIEEGKLTVGQIESRMTTLNT